MEIFLDGSKINNKNDLFEVLKTQIKSDEFYGNNLDALSDVLTSLDNNIIISIYLLNSDILKQNLGDYYNKLINVFNSIDNIVIK